MSKSTTSRKPRTGRYITPTEGGHFSDRVTVKGKSTGEVVVYRHATTGRFATERSARAVDRTVHRYSDALKRLAKR